MGVQTWCRAAERLNPVCLGKLSLYPYCSMSFPVSLAEREASTNKMLDVPEMFDCNTGSMYILQNKSDFLHGKSQTFYMHMHW